MEVLPDDRPRWSSESNGFAPFRSKAARHSMGGAFVLSIRVDASHSPPAPVVQQPQQQNPIKIIVNGTGDRGPAHEESFMEKVAAARQAAIIASTPTVKIISTLPAKPREEVVLSQVQVMPPAPEVSRIPVEEPKQAKSEAPDLGPVGIDDDTPERYVVVDKIPATVVSEVRKGGTVVPVGAVTLEIPPASPEPMVTDVTVVSEVLKVPNGHPEPEESVESVTSTPLYRSEPEVSIERVTATPQKSSKDPTVFIKAKSPPLRVCAVESRVSPVPPKSPAERLTPPVVEERTYEERLRVQSDAEDDVDGKMHFHLTVERGEVADKSGKGSSVVAEDSGAGGLLMPGAMGAIRSSNGTVRGVKNRVRAGIAAFLQHETSHGYRDKERGKVVLYTTSMGVVRRTFHKCLRVKQILRTLLVPFEERDASTSVGVREEIQRRLGSSPGGDGASQQISPSLPQLFVEGQHVGDAEEIERLNETGELRRILKPFQNPDAAWTCSICGGYQRLPCGACGGSKRSSKRNAFTEEFVALRCMVCDEAGLVRCTACT
ncbi:uncharacterized protein LOC124162266 [Ischnura elegans]|uniref:uncharacterized protein LOC124162266 n=1 Tax=Ischnura elegans TaxID=197161 RepID=UPI001ED88BDB|nr:uncharacterized protein LOC124162266 [Ischnura elegans]